MKKTLAIFTGLTLPLAALLLLLSWMPGGPVTSWQPVAHAQATVITVTTGTDNSVGDPIDAADCVSGDPDPCSLREAIQRANSIPGGDVLITFDAAYTITLAYRGPLGDQPVQALDTLAVADLSIDGDLNDDCAPDVVINGANITESNKSGLRLAQNGGVIEGLVIQNFSDGYGIQVANGDNLVIRCNYIGTTLSGRSAAPNRLGVYINRSAVNNQVISNVIAGNSQNGVHIAAYPGYEDTLIPYSNTVSSNWIGTNPLGDSLGNGSKGVLIQHNAYSNTVYNNQIRHNGCYGVHLRGRKENNLFDPDDDEFFPPRGNRIISNTIIANNIDACPGASSSTARAGVVNEDTHLAVSNTLPSLAGADYDNLIAGNVISGNGGYDGLTPVGFGIFNLGASPLISGNVIQGNTDHGVFSQVDFDYTFSPLNAADDILSIPIIQGNTIQDNGGHGIRSLDTAPVAPYQLHISNTVQNNDQAGDGVDVSQAWYGLIEALYGDGTVTGTVPITQNAAPIITNLSYPAYRYELYQPISVGPPDVTYTSTVWSDNNSDDYFNVGTWQVVPQFEVKNGNLLSDYSPQRVQVDLQGGATLTATFSYDGLTTTHPTTNDLLVPSYVETGPYGRYQVAQVYSQAGSGDSDGDGIPDPDECPGGPPCEDTDDDGIPDYIDDDSDGDGIPDADECAGGPPCEDSDGDGIPDYQDPDSDGDGIPDADECAGGVPCQDSDGDGIPDYQDDDDDGDGIPTEDECSDSQACEDTDGDGTPDYLDDDDDGDGIPTEDECSDSQACEDTDGDGIPDYLDDDDDGDGIPTDEECSDSQACEDTDGDGTPDYLDDDDDGDGIPTEEECSDSQACEDTDGDGTPDYLDDDDDGDGIPTDEECSDSQACEDSDGDGTPDYLDPDDDGDGIPTDYENGGDYCQNTTQDSDDDGTPDCQDTDADGDGIPNYLDPDSDGDGTPDAVECPGGTSCPDTDGDGVSDWLDPQYHLYMPLIFKNH